MSESLLKTVITAHHCRSTHHFIVMDALEALSSERPDDWRDMFLAQHRELLRGAKAPDAEFKDFKNHVLHIEEGEWGGARDAAAEWYGKGVDALRRKAWGQAAYALGVMSHYYADPLQPFHTGQTEEEGAIHRAVEWSIAKSRPEIARRVVEMGLPHIEAEMGPGFVSNMVRAAAETSHPYYQIFIDHYDVDVGVKDPPAGLDQTMFDGVVKLYGHAVAGVALLFSRAIADAAMAPPKVNLNVRTYLAQLDIPLKWVTKKIDDVATRQTVKAMYEELQTTGKVIKTLPSDDKAVRKLHARDVLRVPLKTLDAKPLGPLGRQHTPRDGSGEIWLKTVSVAPPAPKPVQAPQPMPEQIAEPVAERLEAKPAEPPKPAPVAPAKPTRAQITPAPGSIGYDDPVDAAPSIGKRTAERLAVVGVHTVGDLLACDPDSTAEALNVRHIPAETIVDWQDQTQLMLAMPNLRVHDAQILVGAGIRNTQDLAAASARDLLDAAMGFIQTPNASRLIAKTCHPDAEEVKDWIGFGKAAAGKKL